MWSSCAEGAQHSLSAFISAYLRSSAFHLLLRALRGFVVNLLQPSSDETAVSNRLCDSNHTAVEFLRRGMNSIDGAAHAQ